MVCAALKKYGVDRVELEPPAALIPPGLRYRPGLREWKVPDPRGGERWLDADGAFPEPVTYKSKQPIKPSMFPTQAPELLEQLDRCIRLLPHDNDAGGFFCAVFVKRQSTAGAWTDAGKAAHTDGEVKDATAGTVSDGMATDALPIVESELGCTAAEGAPPPPKSGAKLSRAAKSADDGEPELVEGSIFQNKQRFRELSADHADCHDLLKFYGLAVPLMLFSFTDKTDADRKIVAVSRGLRDWLMNLVGAKGRLKFKQVQIASFGLRVFKRLAPGYGPMPRLVSPLISK